MFVPGVVVAFGVAFGGLGVTRGTGESEVPFGVVEGIEGRLAIACIGVPCGVMPFGMVGLFMAPFGPVRLLGGPYAFDGPMPLSEEDCGRCAEGWFCRPGHSSRCCFWR